MNVQMGPIRSQFLGNSTISSSPAIFPFVMGAGGSTMRLRDVIRASKEDVKVGSWRFGKVPKADFPLARSPYRLGNSFKWNVIKFSAGGAECRVLVVQNEGKQKYEALLGVMGANGILKVLCSYEYHAHEPGWHCHATHDDSDTISHGIMRGPWIKRVPAASKKHRPQKFAKFSIGDEAAGITFACARYRIGQKGSLI
jgi:hypothetical protein